MSRTARRSDIAWMNGRVVPAAEATVPLADEGFLRGDTVFEAVRVRRGRTHALDAHMRRFERSARALDIVLPPLEQVVRDLLLAWGEADGVLRLYVTRRGTVRGMLGVVSQPDSIAVGVVWAPWRTPVSHVKTTSYAANQWALRRAHEMGADDALIVDDGIVHELPTGALVAVHGERLSSPDPRRVPILESTTARALADVVEVCFTDLTLDDLRHADEVFVLSVSRPVLPVHTLIVDAETRVGLPAPGPVTRNARDALGATIDRDLDPLAEAPSAGAAG